MLLAFGGMAWADDWADCQRFSDDDLIIRGCSNVIAAGRDAFTDKELADAYISRSGAYTKKGKYDRAIADANKSLELNPDYNLSAYYLSAHAYEKKGDYNRAIAGYGKLIELQGPEGPENYVFRGNAYKENGDYDQAIADYNKALELDPAVSRTTWAYDERADAYEKKGDHDRAMADYNKSIEVSPDDGDAYYGRGVVYGAKGDVVKALADFRAAARLSRQHQPVDDMFGGAGNERKAQLQNKALGAIVDLEKQLAAGASAAATPGPGHRVALVIGNSAYRNAPILSNPVNDASLIASALKGDGFVVTVADNLDRDGLIDALKAFATKADNADWAVVYFAGHGIEMGGTNYLIPVDAKLLTDRDVELEAVPSGQVMHAIDGARQLRVVILDACRDNPFADTMRRTAGGGRDIGRGLARIEPARGTLVLYSAKEGTIAADGDGADSPFATALAKHLTEPGIEVDKMFRLVIDDVFDATGDKQEPFMYGSLPGRQDFYFRPRS
jgi:tetratricopeptide (TPR) repeat protein